ncbi:orexigenic neuropeptide QRFP [Heterocephalus glaber]|uniref:Orexigenic neuropeptide QRFP n=1 Tax=Heterocephalus glaber TaxID=10181 RepID=A0A0P6JFT1_HETGA|nr:orexigenic neuropeptide QRFP [Heterocephalus glaber]
MHAALPWLWHCRAKRLRQLDGRARGRAAASLVPSAPEPDGETEAAPELLGSRARPGLGLPLDAAQAPAVWLATHMAYNSLSLSSGQMRGPFPLPYLLLLPLGACLPLLDRRELVDTAGGVGAEGPGTQAVWGASPWSGGPQPQALLLVARELQALGRGHSGLRLGRQEGTEATSFLSAHGSEKATGPLGNLAEELTGYSRRKGGFSFRFGRG